MRWHHPEFTLVHLSFLYTKANECQRDRKQWLRLEQYNLAAMYDAQLEVLVELLENITVFNHGDGLDNFKGEDRSKKTTDERLATFAKLFKKARK